MRVLFSAIAILTLTVFGTTLPAAGQSNPDRTQFGHDIRVAEGQPAADLTCINCSIYVAGNVAGDVTAVKGRVVIEGAGQVAGDVTAVLGDVRVDPGTKIAGDLTVVGGRIHRAPEAQVAGDVTEFTGTGWMALMFAVPLMVLGGIVALIVWLIQRGRRPVAIPARV